MAGTVGVLSTRVRVEEKLLMAALVEAGFVALSVAPAPGPAPLGPNPGWPLAVDSASGEAAGIVIDRLQDRALASALLELTSDDQLRIVDAGLASVGNRLTIAAAIARAGLPRPMAFGVHDEASGLEAAELTGYPATFLPLEPKTAGLTLHDRDTAEAVLEHREMLGQRLDTLGLIQAGDGSDALRVIVSGGRVIGAEGNPALTNADSFKLAVSAAQALSAELVGVVIVDSANGPLIWDIDPAPDFRNAVPVEVASVAAGIAARIGELVASNGALVGR